TILYFTYLLAENSTILCFLHNSLVVLCSKTLAFFIFLYSVIYTSWCAVYISAEQEISPDYCVFPFKYNGQLYHSCTSVNSKHERLWCSLTSDFDQDHLWGYCLGNLNYCEYSVCSLASLALSITDHRTFFYLFPTVSHMPPGEQLSKCQMTLVKPSCIFPFTANGKTYEHCTTDYWFPGIPWCATTPDYNKDQKWVYCPSSGIVLYE
uniref:Fibronectin type-II domain-containing protein n=1 Tax=Scleropages formosus TaxID=113540 RepID=A0A8C9WKI9_SCLFO